MSDENDLPTIEPELPADLEPTDAAPELSLDEKREAAEAECKRCDKEIDALNREIADLRRAKDAIVAEKDAAITALESLRLSPAEELQRHLRVQREARAQRNENIAAAAKAISAAGIQSAPAGAPIDEAMRNRQRSPTGGAR